MKRLFSSLSLMPLFAAALLPLFVLHLIASGVAALLYHVVRYRKELVIRQLSATFPVKNDREIRQLARNYYLNMADQLVEGIKSFRMSRQSLLARYRYLNPEVALHYTRTGRSVILCMGHYANWEWNTIMPAALGAPEVALYTPLKNPNANDIMRRIRERFGCIIVPVAQTAKGFLAHHDKGVLFVLIGDQSPSSKYISSSHWMPFLGRDTAFLGGIARYAKKFDLPVIFMDTQRVGRGYYESTFEVLTDTPTQLTEYEITKRYACRLEAQILSRPECWLWSHRRWKFTREVPMAPLHEA
jgi:KDO2-lipid IV(A) lauroyltransferase